MIGKLAEESPDIAGIAFPDMPQVSPGMPGEQSEEFIKYVISDDGAYHEFKIWNPLSIYLSKDSAATRPSPYMIRISLSGSSSMSASIGYV